jgi:hypothetical protein
MPLSTEARNLISNNMLFKTMAGPPDHDLLTSMKYRLTILLTTEETPSSILIALNG